MAHYQILYWQDLPAQVKAWDDFDETNLDLGPAFMERIDRAAQQQGLTEGDDYLDQWAWSAETECPGEPDDVAEAVKRELEAMAGL